MGRPPWASSEQTVWLEARVRGFVTAQHDDTVDEWLASVYTEWFNFFPLAAPTEKDVAKAGGNVDAARASNVAYRKRVSIRGSSGVQDTNGLPFLANLLVVLQSYAVDIFWKGSVGHAAGPQQQETTQIAAVSSLPQAV